MQSVASCTPAFRRVTHPLAFARALPLESVAPMLCSTCRLRTLCLPGSMQAAELKSIDELVYTRRRIHPGEHLFHAGDRFDALYAFRSGSFKSYVTTSDGDRRGSPGSRWRETSLGWTRWALDSHTQSRGRARHRRSVHPAVCAFAGAGAVDYPALQHQISRIMSREIVREQRMMTLLGTMTADGKVAEFLLSLSHRFAARGYSSTEFNLRMTRADIASYLGLKIETVSRALSKLRRIGVIRTDFRHVAITNLEDALHDCARRGQCDGGSLNPAGARSAHWADLMVEGSGVGAVASYKPGRASAASRAYYGCFSSSMVTPSTASLS